MSGKSETTTYFYSMEKMTGNTSDNRTDSCSVESRDSSNKDNQSGNNSSLRLFDSNKKAFNSLF